MQTVSTKDRTATLELHKLPNGNYAAVAHSVTDLQLFFMSSTYIVDGRECSFKTFMSEYVIDIFFPNVDAFEKTELTYKTTETPRRRCDSLFKNIATE